jgi:hypothetical protein
MNYKPTLRHTGDLTIGGIGSVHTLSLPLQIEDIGRISRRLRRDRAAIVAKAKISVSLNSDWSPNVVVWPDLE